MQSPPSILLFFFLLLHLAWPPYGPHPQHPSLLTFFCLLCHPRLVHLGPGEQWGSCVCRLFPTITFNYGSLQCGLVKGLAIRTLSLLLARFWSLARLHVKMTQIAPCSLYTPHSSLYVSQPRAENLTGTLLIHIFHCLLLNPPPSSTWSLLLLLLLLTPPSSSSQSSFFSQSSAPPPGPEPVCGSWRVQQQQGTMDTLRWEAPLVVQNIQQHVNTLEVIVILKHFEGFLFFRFDVGLIWFDLFLWFLVCEGTQSIWLLYPVNSPLSDHLSGPGANTQRLISGCCISIPGIISIAFVLNPPCYTHSLEGERYVSYSASSADAGNNTMCVSPVLPRCSIPVPAAALGPWTRRGPGLRTGQLCLGSHFSVTEGG